MLDSVLLKIDTRFKYPLINTSFNEPLYIWSNGDIAHEALPDKSDDYVYVNNIESLNRALSMFNENQRGEVITKLYDEEYI